MKTSDDQPTAEHPSKSQRKREMHQLQTLGERLTDLKQEELARLPISEPLRAAILEMRRIKAREGKRRQRQYIGRLMRSEEEQPISAALEKLEHGSIEQKRRLHALETWRDRLINEGNSALSAFIDAHPGANRQQLNQLIRAALKERNEDKPPAASRKLFQLLREIMQQAAV
jgi:ribosome-associated protein